MYSFLIKIAIDAKRPVELVNTISSLGLTNENEEAVTAEPDPNNVSLISINTFFSFKLLHFFL